jgi:integrase
VKSGRNALIDRTRYQFGSLSLKKRAKGADVWEFRHYETQADNTRKRKATFIGTTTQYKNKSDARVAVEALLLRLNEEKPQHHLGAVTFGAICDRYIEEELPERYSTRKSYLSNIKLHIRPRWERYLLHQIRPMVVESWLKKLEMAPKSKAHIRGVMHLMFECAGRWELFNDRRNPMQMVRVKDSTKRRQRPAILTVTEYEANRYIRPRWGDTLLTEVKPAAIDEWLRSLTRLPKPGDDSRTVHALGHPKRKPHAMVGFCGVLNP